MPSAATSRSMTAYVAAGDDRAVIMTFHYQHTHTYTGTHTQHTQHTHSRYFAVSSAKGFSKVQYIPRNMHTVFALLCFVVVIHWLIFPYPSGLLHWHCGNLTIAPVPAKQPWCIWINTSCEFIMNDCITTTQQSTTKPCAYFLGYTVHPLVWDLPYEIHCSMVWS